MGGLVYYKATRETRVSQSDWARSDLVPLQLASQLREEAGEPGVALI